MRFKKIDLEELYSASAPKRLLEELVRLRYELNANLVPYIDDALVSARERSGGVAKETWVVDVGCSFGFTSAALVFGESVEAWHRRLEPHGESECNRVDERWFSACQRLRRHVRVAGIDRQRSAVDYAVSVGLLDASLVCDVETSEWTTQLPMDAECVDVVVVTGIVGYIGAVGVANVARAFPKAILVMSVLEVVDEHPILVALADMGWRVSEGRPQSVVQRLLDSREVHGIAVDARYLMANVYFASRRSTL